MSTAYYLYRIPDKSYDKDWMKTLEGCLEHKELIGIITSEVIKGKRCRCFTFVMHPMEFMYSFVRNSNFYGVEHRGELQLLSSFINEYRLLDIVRYDEENTPE